MKKLIVLFVILISLSSVAQEKDTLRYDFSNEKRKIILRNATEDEAIKFFHKRHETVIYKLKWLDGKPYECPWYRRETFNESV